MQNKRTPVSQMRISALQARKYYAIAELTDWPAAGLSDSRLSYPHLGFIVIGAEIAQCRVAPLRIVEALNVIEHIRFGITPRSIYLPCCSFDFQR